MTDTLKLLAIWLCGLGLVTAMALCAWAARVKARIARSLRLSEALWDARARNDASPTKLPGGDDTAIQPVPVAIGYDTADGPRYRIEWPVADRGLHAPDDDHPLDPLARPGDGWWYGD